MRRVERHSGVGDSEHQFIGLGAFDEHSSASFRIGVQHDVADRFLQCEVDRHIEFLRQAYHLDPLGQRGYLLDIVTHDEREVLSLVADSQHRQVVALGGISDEGSYCLLHRLHEFARASFTAHRQLLTHSLFSELIINAVLGLGQSVGVEEQGVAGLQFGFLLHVFKSAKYSQRKIRYTGEEFPFHLDRRVMTGIAVAEFA